MWVQKIKSAGAENKKARPSKPRLIKREVGIGAFSLHLQGFFSTPKFIIMSLINL